jgi:hypothetical protein
VSLSVDGFDIIDLPPIPRDVLDSYDNVPLDIYMGNQTRYKRFSQYRLDYVGDDWKFELLPHRPYGQSRQFNTVAGGIMREYEPTEADFVPFVRAAMAGLPLDKGGEPWQINIHQNRSRAAADKPGLITPEGVHKDGHDYVMIMVLRRHNVIGGEMRLWQDLNAPEPFWEGTVQAGQVALLDDRAVAHDVTDLLPAGPGPAYRDIAIVAFSTWQERWYGEEFDQSVLNS